jgi:hypothetical protein
MLTSLLFFLLMTPVHADVSEPETRRVSHILPHRDTKRKVKKYQEEPLIQPPDLLKIATNGDSEGEGAESSETRDPVDDRKIKGRRKDGSVRAKGNNIIRTENSTPGSSWRQLSSEYLESKVSDSEAEVPWWKSWWGKLLGSSVK